MQKEKEDIKEHVKDPIKNSNENPKQGSEASHDKQAGSPDEQQEEKDLEASHETEIERLEGELSESKDKYLRLYSEFENFRRRTSKERIDLISSANKELVSDLVPVLDDFERALKAMEESDASQSVEGIELIYNKFKKVLESKGLKKMDIKKGDEFNDDYHEAITQIPAEPELSGKIVDVVESGYFLNEKVIRFAKVVTGAKS